MVRTTDSSKIDKVLVFLKKHPEGTYVSEIARETKLAKSTVSYILTKHLAKKIEEVIVGKKELFKIIRLK